MRYDFHNDLFSVDLIEQYSALFSPTRYNWVDFTFVDFHVEADRMHGTFELELIVLGLGFRIYWTYNKRTLEEAVKKYDKMIKNSKWYSLEEATEKLSK